MKVTHDPADGVTRENSARVLPTNTMPMPAAMMVSGDATPAVVAIRANPKKKLMAGPMLAIVDATTPEKPRAPRCSRPG